MFWTQKSYTAWSLWRRIVSNILALEQLIPIGLKLLFELISLDLSFMIETVTVVAIGVGRNSCFRKAVKNIDSKLYILLLYCD